MSELDQAILDALLRSQGVALDAPALRAATEWVRVWAREWRRVQDLDLGEEDLPAPLWCWPP